MFRLNCGPIAIVVVLIACTLDITFADKVPVTCGSTIKLAHVSTKVRLHSHEVAYSRGSQQQSVTGFPTSDDAQSYWVVHGPKDAPCVPGSVLRKGDALRLQHTATRKWLHSHGFQSPLTSNQEVSAYGSDTESDGGDVWSVEWETKAKMWKQDNKIRLKHRDTNAYLASADGAKFGHPIQGQQEVCAVRHKDKSSEWQTAEGVFMPTLEELAAGEEQGNEEL